MFKHKEYFISFLIDFPILVDDTVKLRLRL